MTTTSKFRIAALVAAQLAIGTAASADDAFKVMKNDPHFTAWVSLINAGDLQGYARDAKRPFTVFAAQNESFYNIPADTLQRILPRASFNGIDSSETVAVVRSHVLAGIHPLNEFSGRTKTLTTVNDLPLQVDATDPAKVIVTFKRSKGYISGPPIKADNALIYPVILTEVHFEAQ